MQKSLHKIPLKSLENGGPAVLKPLYLGTVFLDVQALLLQVVTSSLSITSKEYSS